MSRVSIDAACLLAPRAGVARYLDGLLGGLRRLADDGPEIELLQPASRRPTVRWVGWDLQRISGRLDLLHLPFYYPPLAPKCPVVCAVHDVLVIEHPEWFPRPWADVTARLIRRGARRAEAIITASVHVAERIETLCRVPRGRIEVMPYGVDRTIFTAPSRAEVAAVLGRHRIKGPYVVQMGSFESRRGLDLTLAAMAEVRRGTPELALVLIGDARDHVAELAAPPPWVRRLGRVEDAFLPGLFAGAEAVVAPSRDEGFDLPLLEALACGASVVASDIAVHREHFAPAVELFTSGDAEDLAEALTRVLSGRRGAELRTRAVDHARSFSWDVVAARHAEVWAAVGRTGRG